MGNINKSCVELGRGRGTRRGLQVIESRHASRAVRDCLPPPNLLRLPRSSAPELQFRRIPWIGAGLSGGRGEKQSVLGTAIGSYELISALEPCVLVRVLVLA